MKILFTGFDGFIESHLTEELVKQGYEVEAFVYYNPSIHGVVGYLAAFHYELC